MTAKHWTQRLPRWVSLNPISCIRYIWREDGWPLREVARMWIGATRQEGDNDRVEAFFREAAHRRYKEATNYVCVYGCCTVIWGSGKRGNMGGYGPAGCPCDDLDDPRDLTRGPVLANA